jgi:hypothetical protein
MPIVPTEFPSIREQILEALQALFVGMEEGQPELIDNWGNPLGYDFTFSQDCVVRHPLTEKEENQRFAIAVIDGPERKIEQIQFMTSQLDVTLEFSATLGANELPSPHLNMMLSNIQRKIREDIQLGGLADRVVETANDIEIDDWGDRRVRGSVFIQVQYKHSENDPRRRI